MPIFMIGTQRSGSNMLRLMLNQLPELAAPHPPHVLERLAPLRPVYGNLADDGAFAQLVEDVCRLVETNPVPWDGVTLNRDAVAAGCRERSLVAVHGAVHDILARARDRRDWLCKSLSNIHHLPALTAYHPGAKFIYLHRDGRDVAASFKQAVVGEKHVFQIARHWQTEQQLALRARETLDAGRFFTLGYEQLIETPEERLRALCAFLEVEYRPEMLEFHRSEEARHTAQAGHMWSNVTRPVMRRARLGFLDHLDADEIGIIESLAGSSLDRLGYGRVAVKPGEERAFSAEDIARFDAENARLKAEFRTHLDPEERRLREPQERLLAAIAARAGRSTASGSEE